MAMDLERLKQARANLGIGATIVTPEPAPEVVSEPIPEPTPVVEVEPVVLKQPEQIEPKNPILTEAEQPLEGLDVLSQELLETAQPAVEPKPAAPETIPEPLPIKTEESKGSVVPGILTMLGGAGLMAVGALAGGKR